MAITTRSPAVWAWLVVSGFVGGTVSLLSRAYVIQVLWAWTAVTYFRLPPLPFACVVLGIYLQAVVWYHPSTSEEQTAEQIAVQAWSPAVLAWMCLGLAWVWRALLT